MPLDLALDAISHDLDALGAVTGDLAGQIEAVQAEVEATRDDVREILRMLRDRVLPKLDRIGEIDELRGKIGRVEVDIERAGLHLLQGGGE